MKIIYTVLKASPLNVVCLESVDVVNSIYYTINSYLDLGTGVLILWYGGILAMEGKDGLTPGIDVIYITYGCAYVYDR
jgi:ABC-type bacteriocin/lantibiotic exporter with double-glycine peptidase domain